MSAPTSNSTLLICTVGGSPEPVVESILHWRPLRVLFIPTEGTEHIVVNGDDARMEEKRTILETLEERGFELDAGRYKSIVLSSGDSIESVVSELERLKDEVEDWLKRGDEFNVVADFTGGTKTMSAALALHASRWPCTFSYIAGSKREKGGLGHVATGHEVPVHHANPWNSLGYQAIQEFTLLFDRHAYAEAANIVSQTAKRVTAQSRKRELFALEHLAKAFDGWDRFDHKAAFNAIENVLKVSNDLNGALGNERGDVVTRGAKRLSQHLEELLNATPPSSHYVIDLLANARRRREEGRFDDAVARLYRAIEAIAQIALKERHDFSSTEQIPLDRVPEPLRTEWRSRESEGHVRIGLQDAYALLSGLQDPLGEKFRAAGLHQRQSPLTARNQSILAHGFQLITDKTFNSLWKHALSLADIDDKELPSFPKLGSG